ncbi:MULTISPECIES: S41 family peptidase [unclassified Clostridium]|uniref:S41 family peptidase n=1 Tax=unclassified Clostridium TaxID=2614128 RepID=UPI00110654E1|nr:MULTISPECIES: S41 family peptidase [unclassified Clostridium]
MYSKQSVVRLAIVLILATAIFSVGGTVLVSSILQLSGEQVAVSADEYASIERFARLDDVYQRIMKNYYETPDSEKLINGAIKGMVEGLDDPYSRYYTPEEYTESQQDAEGLYYGIGVVVSMDKDTHQLNIIKVYSDTPAQEVDLRKGDVIASVDGADLSGMELNEITALIKGEELSQVKLTILRDGQTLEKTLTRRQVTVDRVEWHMMVDNIGYIQISEFRGNVLEKMEAAIAEMKDKGAKGIVLDLRDNPGGMMDIVVPIADMLLPEGLIVYTEDVNGNRREEKSDAEMLGLPLTVLINGNSASASEILAGAIQDYGAGTLIGTTTYGKGIVQSIMPYKEDGAALQITTSRYFTPNGRNIHGEGIAPDITVEMPEELLKNPQDLTEENDPQLQKALEVLKSEIK